MGLSLGFGLGPLRASIPIGSNRRRTHKVIITAEQYQRMMSARQPQAGWYPNPDRTDTLRYFNGKYWTHWIAVRRTNQQNGTK